MYLAPDGNIKDQVKYMHKKSTAWATSIQAGGVQQNESWKSLNSTIPQTIKYPLPSITLNDKYFKHIMQPIVKFGITKAGISSTFHIAVRYGPNILEALVYLTPLLFKEQDEYPFSSNTDGNQLRLYHFFVPTYPLYSFRQEEGGVY